MLFIATKTTTKKSSKISKIFLFHKSSEMINTDEKGSDYYFTPLTCITHICTCCTYAVFYLQCNHPKYACRVMNKRKWNPEETYILTEAFIQ